MGAKISKTRVASIIFAALAVVFWTSGATIAQTRTTATAKLATAKPQTLSASEKQHLQYILSNTSPVVPHKLNLADPEQYAYVMDTLRRFGRTTNSNPQLFRMLEKARKGSAGPPKLMTTADVAEGSGATLGGINYTTKFGLDSNQNYEANSFSSYPPGQIPANTQVLVSLIDKDNNIVLNQNSASKFNTTNVQVPVTAPAPQDHSDIIANTMFLIAPANGGPLSVYNVVLEDRVGVSQACQQSPNYSPVLGTSAQCQTNAATTCVNNGTTTKQIKVCYGNRIQSDCDYGCQGSSNPPNIIFPIQGSVNLGQAPSTPLTGSLYVVLNLAPSGGCQLLATNNALGSLTGLISVNSANVASWNFPPAQFPNQNCLQTTANGKLLNYSFTLYLQTSNGAVGATFTSDVSQLNLPNTFPVPQMSVLVGCLPAGARIRMADGSDRAIETFTGKGETVRSPDLDAPAVTATTWGSEDLPMVVIRDSLGHRLTLTEGHPVLTTRGPIMASKLKVGDVVLTETGNAALVSVERLAHQEPVPIYNLTIGTEKQAADGRTTFYADGILVGDQQMQEDLAVKEATPRALSQMEILRALPVSWRQDYVNSLRHD